MAVLRPGPSRPGSESPWLGASKATTHSPAATSGRTNASRCSRQPPQPRTRHTVTAGAPVAGRAKAAPPRPGRDQRPDERVQLFPPAAPAVDQVHGGGRRVAPGLAGDRAAVQLDPEGAARVRPRGAGA